ncbi:hypothetical protein [Ruminococcus flavefaciens]|uniref:hypothetical protein n=1 Tax=Ruminococcus flavefaciens TaxID=1265 RepID=UPI0003671322|nr:hypothetical protein [Ruminococcus flavefaciens]
MAFVNEKLTKQYGEEFKSWGLKRPSFGFGKLIKEVPMEVPYYWTADHERKMYLMGASNDRDYPDEKVFIFIWNGKKNLVQFNISFEDNDTVVWRLPEQYLINNTFPFCEEEGFIDDLRDALTAHGAFGWNDKDNKTKCEF